MMIELSNLVSLIAKRARCVAVLLGAFVPWCEAFSAPHPSLPPPVVPECLGVNIHFTDPKPGEMEMLAAAGFKWVRMDLTWAATERKPGEYDFSAYDRLVAALDQHKLRAVFILDYGNPLYAEPGDKHPFTSRAGTAEFREAFAKWAVAAVTRYRGKGFIWELWNEPNHEGFWKPKPNVADYVALAKATGEALRAAGLVGGSSQSRAGDASSTGASAATPPAPVPPSGAGSPAYAGECFIGPATSTIDLAFLEGCFKAGLLEFWDAVSVHPYRQSAPETVEEELRSLRLLIRRYAPAGKTIPIVSGEWGYSTAWPNFAKDEAAAEEKQAKYLARQFLTNMANDVALSIWYDWRDDGDNPKDPEHRFGLVRRKYHEGRDPVFDPKPAYTAMKTMTEQLGGFRFSKVISDWPHRPERRWHCLFAKGEQMRVVAWTSGPWPTWTLCPREEGAIERRGYLGQVEAPIRADAKVPTVNLQVAPSYFAPLAVGPVWRLADAWERAPREAMLESPGTVTFRTMFRNPLSKPVAARTWCSIDGRWAEGDMLYTIRMLRPENAVQPGESVELQAEMKVTGREAPKSIELWAGFWIGDKLIEEVCQPVRLIITNPLGVEPLPLEAETLPIRVNDSSGRGLSGELWLRGKQSSARNHFKIPSGGTTTVVHVAASELEKVAPAKAFEPGVRINTEEETPVFDRPISLPVPCPSNLLIDVQAVSDGAREVDASVSFTRGEPATKPPGWSVECMRLKYAVAAGWKFASLRTAAKWDAQSKKYPLQFALWVFGDGQGCQARIRFKDSTGQVFQPDGPKIDWKGWRYVTFPMQSTPEKPLAHWGGANDGVIHYPIEWDSIFLLDNVSRQPVEGEIYLSAPTLIY